MRAFLLIVAAVCCFGSGTAGAEDGYVIDHKWSKSLTSYGIGEAAGVGVDSHNHVFVFHRGARAGNSEPNSSLLNENTVLMLDGTSGEILNKWGANRFFMPHGMAIDAEDNVWVTDVEGHTVQKFSHDGEHLLTLGTEGVGGDDANHFNRPAGIGFSKSGDVFIADGYINTRVAKFTAQGDYLMSWGKPGKGAGEFSLVHSVSVTLDDIVYVADRRNRRLQVFDTNGNFIKIIPTEQVGRAISVAVDKEGQVFVTSAGDNPKNRGAIVIALDKEGAVKAEFDTNFDKSERVRGHGIAVGDDGAIYVADLMANRVVKVVKRK